MIYPITIYYGWGKYILPEYDRVLAHAINEGTAPVETIEKLIVSEFEFKRVASFYYCRT